MSEISTRPGPARDRVVSPRGSDAALVRRAAAGDRSAWHALVTRYSNLVWGIARVHRLSHADAADAAQTTWLRLVEHAGSLSQPDRVSAWLATTARRECLRVLRKAERLAPVGHELPESADDPDLDADLVRAERAAALWEAFARLRPSDQALLRMLVADPAPSYAEIADALGMPLGSVGPTRARCLQRLRDLLGASQPFQP